MANLSENQWFKSAEAPFTDIAHILLALDERGVIPADMRDAIYQHADNSADTLPNIIAGAASALASAVAGDSGLEDKIVSRAAWGMTSLAEQVHGWLELQSRFRQAKAAGGHHAD